MQSLKGKNAIITGGSRGLGKAIALALAQEGVNIAITGRDENSLIAVAAEIATLDVKVCYAAFDIKVEQDVNDAMAYFIETLGSVDILINNAGIAQFGSFMEMPSAAWMEMLQTNVMGLCYTTKAVLPDMIAQNNGDIINVSSTSGLTGNAGTAAYAASKFAVVGLSEALMKEVRKNNIRVCTLTPSTIASDMSLSLGITDGNPEKVLQPEDFAELVVAILKMNKRALIKTATIISTNP